MSKIWLINSLLVILICVLVLRTYDLWLTENHIMTEASTSETEKHSKPTINEPAINYENPGQDRNKSHFKPMVEKNLFFPDRIGHIEEAPPEKSTSPQQQKQSEFENYIALYGVTMTGEEKTALISNPNHRKGESKTRWVEVGDHIKGRDGGAEIEIVEIHRDRIVMSVHGESFSCEMYKDSSNLSATAQSGYVEQNQPSPSPSPSREAKQPPTEISPDGKYRIIDTPFGKIKRRIN